MEDTNRRRIKTIRHADQVPRFATEAEEHAFWSAHDMSDEQWKSLPRVPDSELPPPRPRTQPVEIFLEDETLQRIKALAAERGIRHQKMLKQFVLDRLEEEHDEDMAADRDPDRCIGY